jgi:acyl-CoA reductase-like NAD-dependent aldehyde dehydrogenase
MTTTDTGTTTLGDNEDRASKLLDREWAFLVGGRRTAAAAGATFTATSPYSGDVIAAVPDGTRVDAGRAVDAALAAAPAWGREPTARRGQLVARLADALEARARDFAVLDSLDGGAPFRTMLLDVQIAVEGLRYFAGLALELKGYTVPASANLHFTERQPYGVVGKIIPFNHPLMFAATKIAAPLVAGNAVVLKPSEATPLSALLLADLIAEIFPPGVVNVVTGDGPAVPDAIVRHPKVRRIGFTGSEATGRAIQKAAAETAVKHVTLELGGKNALIAFPDADPAEVARAAIQGMNFTWSGQSCGSTSRVLLHEGIADAVLAEVTAQLAVRRYPSPLDPDAIQGTMVSQRQFDRVIGYIDSAVADGADVIAGGRRPASAERGLFIEPTFLRTDPSMRVSNEEIFGPVVSVMRWTDPADAIAIANSVEYGLTGSVFTGDLGTALRTARALETGYVWVNNAGPHFLGLPYGGWKGSGVGHEESIEELFSYSQIKSVSVML